MSTAILTVCGTIIGALISGGFMYWSYHETSSATMKSSNSINRANSRNMYISQYNNLFERCDKLENELYQFQRDSVRNSSDELVFYQLLKRCISVLQEHKIPISRETTRFMNNITRKLKEDSQNSL